MKATSETAYESLIEEHPSVTNTSRSAPNPMSASRTRSPSLPQSLERHTMLRRYAAFALALSTTACGGKAVLDSEQGTDSVSLLATPRGVVPDVILVDDEVVWLQTRGGHGQEEGAVMRAPVEPNAETTRFVGEGIAIPFALAQDGDRIYWCANKTLSGCGFDDIECTAPQVLAEETPCHELAADDGQLYLVASGLVGKVTSCPTPTCDAFEPIFEGTPSPATLTADRGELYWSTKGSSSVAAMDTQVASCKADDCQATVSKMAAGFFGAVVTDPAGNDIYFAGRELDDETYRIWSCARPACDGRATLYTSSDVVFNVAADDERIYFVELHEEVGSDPVDLTRYQASLSSCPTSGCEQGPTLLATAVVGAKPRILVAETALVWLTAEIDGVFLHVPK